MAVVHGTGTEGDARSGKLKREIGVFEVMALSVAIMGPTGSMALNGSLTAATDGTATALAFVGAAVAIGLVAYSFIEFGRQFAHSGSVYIFNGKSFGARFGFLSAWVVLFAYAMLAIGVAILSADFLESFLSLVGVSIPWVWPALFFLGLMWALVYRSVKFTTRTSLTIEGISVALILILIVIILVRGGAAHHLSTVPFQPGTLGFSAVALASVFGFLSFAGFEGAATLGEEAHNPRRAIPRALIAAVLVTGIFYILAIYTQAEGFGTSVHGVKEFATSSAPLAQLAHSYVGKWMAMIVDLGAMSSSFASGVGLFVAASRILFALSRDGFGPKALGRVHLRFGSPHFSLGTLMVCGVVLTPVLFVAGLTPAQGFGDLGVLGVLALLLVYIATQVSAIRMFSQLGIWHRAQFAIPAAAVVLMGYTLYSNVWPIPAAPGVYFPYIVIAWVVIGVVFLVAWPNLAASIGRSFVEGSAGEIVRGDSELVP
jgi:amino acid transporter